MKLADALTLEIARARDEAYIERFVRTVADAIAPFKPGKVTVWMTDGTSWPGKRMLCVEVENIRRYGFKMVLDDHHLAYPGEIADLVATELFCHFRDRPTLPVGDHVQLGEN